MYEEEQIDPVLATLVKVANDNESHGKDEIHVTLVVGGATVTGILMSNAEWLEVQVMVKAFAETLRKDQAEQDAVMAAVEGVGDVDPRWVRAVYPESRLAYLHLGKARFFAGSNLVLSKNGNSNGMYWRCKLSDVSGWVLGSLGEGAPTATVEAAA